MKFYVEVHETLRYVATLEARSIEEAENRARELARDGELDCEVLDREVVVVERANAA